MEFASPQQIEYLEGFINCNEEELEALRKELGLAMNYDDFKFCQDYFKNEEKRDPSITEIRVLDTYWSDHCRHTTFLTNIKNIKIEDENLQFLLKKLMKNI